MYDQSHFEEKDPIGTTDTSWIL